MSEYPQILKIIGLASAVYLFWIGFHALRSKTHDATLSEKASSPTELSPYQALSMGFIVNVTNPKCIIYFVSFLSSVLAADHDRLTSIC
jgi:threonine/homoserine/homoserine lactone efflux protein